MEIYADSLQAGYAAMQKLFSLDTEIGELEGFLRETGFLNPGGSFYKERIKKFHEVINFSTHVVKALNNISRKEKAVLLECGCGRSYLSFFLDFITSKKPNRDIHFMGVDQNPILIQGCERVKEKLKLTNMDFFASRIIDFKPPKGIENTHGVLSLHACDTATDEAIAKGILLNSRYIIVAPCCQREIVRKMSLALGENEHPFGGIVEKYYLKENLGVILTEILRTLILEAVGYEVDVFSFLSSKYTPKNMMIRARRTGHHSLESLQNYQRLKSFFHLKPKIEEYLPDILKE